MTTRQRVLARAALGLPNTSKRSYRNRDFVAEPSRAHAVWRGLVQGGNALGFPRHGSSTLDLFVLTLAGARQALELGESLDPEDFPNA